MYLFYKNTQRHWKNNTVVVQGRQENTIKQQILIAIFKLCKTFILLRHGHMSSIISFYYGIISRQWHLQVYIQCTSKVRVILIINNSCTECTFLNLQYIFARETQ